MGKLRLFYDGGDMRIYEYKPNIFRLFYKNCEKLTPQRYVRFLLELMRGYRVYYLSVADEIVGYCVISPGGGRYNFATAEDIVVGPYFVLEKFRGNHYSETLVRLLLDDGRISYKDAYDWIRKSNIPSMKCSRRVGFEVVGEANLSVPFRRIRRCGENEGEYYILKYTK